MSRLTVILNWLIRGGGDLGCAYCDDPRRKPGVDPPCSNPGCPYWRE